MKKGFTLMEVFISVAVIITALVGVLSLATISVSSVRINRSKIIADGLAEEGLELVKNIRENNWLNYKRKANNWRDGLSPGDYRVQYNLENLLSYGALPLKIDSNGFYQYDNGADTLFYRKITIQHIGDYQIRAIVQITWQEGGKSKSLTAEARFYNWLEESE
jgi:type II secretory pathway pseudopilin PulG